MDLKEEAALGAAIDTHWYYQSKARMMAARIGRCREVLDVGAGSGFFSRWLLARGLAESATCVDPGYEADRDEAVAGRPIRFRRRIEESTADLVLMMDVLEHVDDDIGLLADYLGLVTTGTRVFITVPAFEFIWSAHDDFLEHRRRYTLSRLRDVVNAAGASELAGHYYFGAVFPLAAAMRLMSRGRKADRSDMGPLPGPFNATLSAVCAAERQVMGLNRLAGLSVVMLCEK